MSFPVVVQWLSSRLKTWLFLDSYFEGRRGCVILRWVYWGGGGFDTVWGVLGWSCWLESGVWESLQEVHTVSAEEVEAQRWGTFLQLRGGFWVFWWCFLLLSAACWSFSWLRCLVSSCPLLPLSLMKQCLILLWSHSLSLVDAIQRPFLMIIGSNLRPSSWKRDLMQSFYRLLIRGNSNIYFQQSNFYSSKEKFKRFLSQCSQKTTPMSCVMTETDAQFHVSQSRKALITTSFQDWFLFLLLETVVFTLQRFRTDG